MLHAPVTVTIASGESAAINSSDGRDGGKGSDGDLAERRWL
jgi:hypothetical protein